MSRPGGAVMRVGRPMSTPGEGAARHQALLYRGPEDFTSIVGSFIRAGLAAGGQVLPVLPAGRLSWIQRGLGAADPGVRLADAMAFYSSLGRATRALADWLQAQAAAGRVAHVVAEWPLAGRPEAEIQAYLRAEAAANVIYQEFPVTLLCPFQAALPEPLLADVRRTHPELVDDGGAAASQWFTDPGRFIRERSAVTDPPLSAASIGFGSAGDLGRVRRFARIRLATAGLGDEVVQLLMTAVGEVVTNALAHGRAPRRLWVYPDGDYLVCHVHDSGCGLADPLTAYLIPEPQAQHGHGLWLARQIADSVEVASDQTGTHVRLLARHAAAQPPDGADHRAAVP